MTTKQLLIVLLTINIGSRLSGEAPFNQLQAESYILLDYATGETLAEKESQREVIPASMTKLATLFMAWEAIEKGQLSLNSPFIVPYEASAAGSPPGSSLMGLKEGEEVTLLQLMQGTAIASGNDAAYAIAFMVGGSVDSFVQQMNVRMDELGLTTLYFVDPSGWSPENRITVAEYALLARLYIARFPQALPLLHSVPEIEYNRVAQDGTATKNIKKNTNLLLGRVEGVDGLKTGFLWKSGFNFSATAQRENTRLIAVVTTLFTPSVSYGIKRRAEEASLLLEYGFQKYETVFPQEPPLEPIKLWKGESLHFLPVKEAPPLYTVLKEEKELVKGEVVLYRELFTAPLPEETPIGELLYTLNGRVVERVELFPDKEYRKGPLYRQIIDSIRLFFKALFNQL